ncbi:hypothetical protein [Natrinema hispanicum]|uniref:hypothetical protein n=1 Tax=Natrinema hispanicum TaxID=392421 RepID=UPI00158799DA|nr:hypothetical protein [Natrinema hispanicum]
MTALDLEAETWTCPHCETSFTTTSPIVVGVHRVRCPDAPDIEQADLEDFVGGASA